MSSSSRFRTAASGLATVVASLLVAGAASGASKVPYSGKTSQHESISFAISSGKLIGLALRIDIRCASHHVYRLPTSRFTAVPIKGARFDQKFKSPKPKATFTLKGQVGRKQVTGSIALREFVAKEHHFCSGAARFAARPRSCRFGFAQSALRYYDAGQRTKGLRARKTQQIVILWIPDSALTANTNGSPGPPRKNQQTAS
jgi:hypothetical protein